MPGTLPVIGDILEAEVLSAYGSQIGVNILHYRVATIAGSGVTLQQICDQMDTLWSTNYKNIISNLATYRGVGLTNLMPPRSLQAVSTVHAGVGTGGASILPTQVRGLISWYSNAAGRRYRGRNYIPFPPTNGATPGGDPLPAYVTLMDAVRFLFQTPITVTVGANSTTVNLSILHRKDVPITASDVTIGVTRTRFATQRRSGAYGRANFPPF